MENTKNNASDVQETKLPYSDKPDNIEAYFASGQFEKDHKRFRKNSGKKTGFDNMDKKQSLFPGLYVLGAIPGLGKTTFAHQMADNLAKAGEHVLYFTLEQSQLEMVSKSLARTSFVNYFTNGRKGQYFTSLQIRSGKADGTKELEEAVRIYRKSVGDRLSIISANFGLSVRQIQSTVVAYIKKYQVRPIVIVDYLQIIAPDPDAKKMDARGNIDDIIHTLKVMQTNYSLTVIAICSFNRVNYTKQVDFESFKESGGIEYTADIIWGMQLQIMSSENDKLSVNQSRKQVDEAKKRIPRKVELCCLKNRFGNLYSCGFNYFCHADYFDIDMDYEKKQEKLRELAESMPEIEEEPANEAEYTDDFSDIEEVQDEFI